MWLLLAALASAAGYRGDAAHTGRGDGSVLVNNRVAWSRKVADRLLWPMGPVVAKGIVLVGTGDGHLKAFTTGGAPLWDVALAGPVAAPPTVDGDDVYVADGTGGLWALSLSTGATRWHLLDAKGRVVGAPVVSDGIVVFEALDRVVRAVRAADGAGLWTYPMDGAAEGAPTAADGRVYLATADKKVRALSLADGSVAWQAELGAASRGTVAAADGLVLVGARDGGLSAFDAATGAVRWRYAVGGFVDSSPAIADGLAVVGSSSGEVHAVSLTTGQRKWSYVAGSPVTSSPTVSGGQVVVGSGGGVVHVLDLATGRVVYQIGVGAAVDGSPTIVDGQAFVGAADGRVVALGEPAFVAVPPSVGHAVVLAVDAPVWFGRRLYLGALGQLLAGAGGGAAFLVGQDAGLLRSADGGLSWSTVPLPDDEKVRQVLSAEGNSVLAVGSRSLLRSADGGLSWQRVGDAPATWGGERRRILRAAKRRLALGADLLASADGGLTWTTLAPPGTPLSAAIHPVNPDVLLVGGPSGELWRSADSGLRWETVATAPAPLVALGVNDVDPARLLAGGGDGSLLRSADGGLTWKVVAAPPAARNGVPVAVTSLVWAPRSPTRAYAALADGRVFTTADGGEHWTEATYGLPEDQAIVDAALDVGADGAVLVAVRLADGGGGVYRLGKVADHARLESVTFATGSAELSPGAAPLLDKLFARMAADPSLRLRAEGHTDDVGADDDNLVLSVARAKAVAEAAAAHGIAPARVLTFGYGESRPIAGNDAEDGRAANRRVELYLVRLP